MFTLKIENSRGDLMQLSQNEGSYQIVNIEGLNPPEADLYTNAVVNMDGQKFKSSKLQMRNVVITLKINGEVEKNRLNIYKYIGSKKWCKIYYTNGNRDVYTEGYCETIECPLFEQKQEMQISIVCPNPYLQSLEAIYIDISKTIGLFEFPFDIAESGIEIAEYNENRRTAILNFGDLETGIVITLSALSDNIVDPIIYNSLTGEYMLINETLNKGDRIVIDTNKGKKSITKIEDGEETNIINSLSGSSSWLQIGTGYNEFTYNADNNEPFLQVVFEYNNQYEGV